MECIYTFRIDRHKRLADITLLFEYMYISRLHGCVKRYQKVPYGRNNGCSGTSAKYYLYRTFPAYNIYININRLFLTSIHSSVFEDIYIYIYIIQRDIVNQLSR